MGSRKQPNDPTKGGSYLQFGYTWTVALEKASRLTTFKYGECMKSARFVTRAYGQCYTWQIELYPNGFTKEHTGWMSVFLVLLSGSRPQLRGNYVLGLVDRHMNKTMAEESNEAEFVVDEGVGHSRYCRLDLKEMRAQGTFNDSRTLVIDYQLNLDAEAFKLEPQRPADSMPQQNGRRVMSANELSPRDPYKAELYAQTEKPLSNTFYDVRVLSGDGVKFYCHSDDLRDASDQLAKICSTRADGDACVCARTHLCVAEDGGVLDDVLEIEIDKVAGSSVREVLRYVYLGKAELNDKRDLDITGILNLAHQWDLRGLIAQCENYLLTNTRAENAVDAYLCAMEYHLDALKPHAQSEILANLQVAINSPHWPRLTAKTKYVTALFAAGPIHESYYISTFNGRLPNENPTPMPTRVRTSYGMRVSRPSSRQQSGRPQSAGVRSRVSPSRKEIQQRARDYERGNRPTANSNKKRYSSLSENQFQNSI